VPGRIRLAVIALALPCLTLRAAAQTVGSLDAAVSRIGYNGIPGVTAYSLSPTFQLFRNNGSLLANGAFSGFTGGRWTFQGISIGSIFVPRNSDVQVELGGTLAGSVDDDGNKSAEALGQARLHFGSAGRGLWVGGGLGRGYDGISWQTIGLLEAAAWARLGDVTAVLSTSPNWVGSDLSFLDTQATARWVHGPIELSAYGGIRGWFKPEGADGTEWGGATLAVWLTRNLAIVGAGGSFPDDFAQGFPGGAYVSLSVRIANRRPPAPSGVAVQEYRLLRPLARPVVPSFKVTTMTAPARLVRVHAQHAMSVELAGDFTDWEPVALRRGDDGDWSAVIVIPKGTHRVNLRVDGGPWGVPPGIPALNDDFGGVVGVLVIE
jgi:hypothetical protein